MPTDVVASEWLLGRSSHRKVSLSSTIDSMHRVGILSKVPDEKSKKYKSEWKQMNIKNVELLGMNSTTTMLVLKARKETRNPQRSTQNPGQGPVTQVS